jgi:DNA-binding NarL/FixJ family response regulator
VNPASSPLIGTPVLVPNQHELQRGEVCRYPIRLILANPQPMVMWSQRVLIEQFARHIEVVGEVLNIASLEELLSVSITTVVLLDISLMTIETLPQIQELIQHHSTQVLVIGNSSEEWLKREGIAHGIRGFIDRDDPPPKLFRGIEALHNGDTWLNPIWLSGSTQQFSHRPTSRRDTTAKGRIASLTKCEYQTMIFMHKLGGEKNDVVADALNISPSTLRNRLSIIYEKLDVPGKAGLILFVAENGLEH